MFESLTDRLTTAIRKIRGLDSLTEENMAESLKEVRTALLSADVHFKVAREFVERVKAQAVGLKVVETVSPGQMIVKVIYDELTKLLGDGGRELLNKKPLRILMVGLHGSGKTTSTAKLGRFLTKKGYKPMVIACDVYRPAAIDQLETLARQEKLLFYCDRGERNVPVLGQRGLEASLLQGADAVIFDTAGRLQIDAELIKEVQLLKEKIQPDEVLLVADSALGQEAVNVAKAFHEALGLTGIVLTKLDGDARGGAALSMKEITKVPIKFAGTGEKTDDFDLFHPERMADRILGMGDVATLVELAQEKIDAKEAEKMAAKLQNADFDLQDFLDQMKQVQKLGSMNSILGMMPGLNGLKLGDAEEKKMRQTEAIILSMTAKERRNPDCLSASRRDRVAKGSGTGIRDVNAMLKNFEQMRGMMRMLKGKKGKDMMRQMEKEMKSGKFGDMKDMAGKFPGLT